MPRGLVTTLLAEGGFLLILPGSGREKQEKGLQKMCVPWGFPFYSSSAGCGEILFSPVVSLQCILLEGIMGRGGGNEAAGGKG